MIRDATLDDVPALVALGHLMHAEAPHFRGLAWDGDKVARLAEHLIGSPLGFARVLERDGEVVGGILAMAVEHWCSPDLVSCDLALFVRPDCRGGTAAARMLCGYREWAHGLGCKLVQFGVMTGVCVEQTEALAKRLGWTRQGVVLCA